MKKSRLPSYASQKEVLPLMGYDGNDKIKSFEKIEHFKPQIVTRNFIEDELKLQSASDLDFIKNDSY